MTIQPKKDLFRETDLKVYSNFNFICEIPKYTRKKFELNVKKPGSPIEQDTNKDGSLREYKYGDVCFNYGALPQTYEDPSKKDFLLNEVGDDDPLDAIEVGCLQMRSGEVKEVKVLGAVPLLDQGEADWKVLVIRVDDPFARDINDVDDIEKVLPGSLEWLIRFLTEYKTAEGKQRNKLGLEGKVVGKETALKVIEESHLSYKKLFCNGGSD